MECIVKSALTGKAEYNRMPGLNKQIQPVA